MNNGAYLIDQLKIINDVYANSLESKNTTLNIPGMKTAAYEHQKSLICGMYNYRMKMMAGAVINDQILRSKIGIIGDPPGTGKTFSILSYIALIMNETTPSAVQGELSHQSNRYFYSNHIEQHVDTSATHLIIVPPHLLGQWTAEIDRHTCINTFIIENRRILRNRSTANLITNSQCVLTTNKMYKFVNDFAKENNIRWKNIFIDEATTIHFTVNDPPLEFDFLWLIANDWLGFLFKNMWVSPSNLIYIQDRLQLHPDCIAWLKEYDAHNQNINTHIVSSSFLKNYIPFGHELRGHMIIRNSNSTLESSITGQYQDYDVMHINCKQTYTMNMLRQMPENTICNANIIPILDSLNINKRSSQDLITENPERSELIQTKIDDLCSICLDKQDSTVLPSCCLNAFCGVCIIQHLLNSNTCATCRAPQTIDDIIYVPKDNNATVTGQIMNRHDTCVDYIKKHPNESILIFTTFENTYYQLLTELERIGAKSDRLEINTLQQVVTKYNDGNINVLFLSNIDSIRGLNLSKTQHLIFFYELPFYEQRAQLISSVQRLKKMKKTTIVHLQSQEL